MPDNYGYKHLHYFITYFISKVKILVERASVITFVYTNCLVRFFLKTNILQNNDKF